MKASLLYAGEYYAYYRDPPKGKIPVGAVKVRLRYTEARKKSYMENRTTYAGITLEDGREMLVKARELIDFWDSYKEEEAILLKERKDREKANRRHSLRTQITESMIGYRLQERSLPLIVTGFYSNYVSFNLSSILDWLGITEEEITKAIESAISEEFDEK